jgi:hypothetical protein
MATDTNAQDNGQSSSTEPAQEKPSTPAKRKASSQGAALAVKSKEESSAIEVSQPRFFMGNRPIEPTTLKVMEMTAVGNRPIFASEIQVVNSDLLPGHRPIIASKADLLNADMILGNRPIASNDIDDPLILMGYLD